MGWYARAFRRPCRKRFDLGWLKVAPLLSRDRVVDAAEVRSGSLADNPVGLPACPLHPRKRTSRHQQLISAMGQLRTHAPQTSAAIRLPRGHWKATRATPLCENPQSSASHLLVAGSERSTPIL